MATDASTATLADRLAITDVLVRYFELVDAKGWDHMHEVFTADTTAPLDAGLAGGGPRQHRRCHAAHDRQRRDRHLPPRREHGARSSTATRAEVTVRVRAMHHGVGSAGRPVLREPRRPAHPAGADAGRWRIAHHEWQIVVKLGRPGGAVRTRDRRRQAVLTRMATAPSSLHPRLSVNSICSMHQTLDEDLALWAELGVDHVGLITPKFDAPDGTSARQTVLDAGLRVSSVSCYREGIARLVGAHRRARLRRSCTCRPGGPGRSRGRTPPEQFCDEIAPHVAARPGAGGATGSRADQSAPHRRELRPHRARRRRTRPHGRRRHRRRLLLRVVRARSSNRSCARTSTSWRSCRSATTSSAPSTCRIAAPSATATSRWSDSCGWCWTPGTRAPSTSRSSGRGSKRRATGRRSPAASNAPARCSRRLGA